MDTEILNRFAIVCMIQLWIICIYVTYCSRHIFIMGLFPLLKEAKFFSYIRIKGHSYP